MNMGPRIVIADHSELAVNIYKLLLAPIGVTLIVRRRFEEARPHFFKREKIDLAIFNSNIFGKKFTDIVSRIVEDEPLRMVKKLFICKNNPTEDEWRKRLNEILNTTTIIRPFHPDEFIMIIRKLIT